MEENTRGSKSKKAVRDALLALMQTETPDKITISELSEKAGINRKTFYAHYQTIDDVFLDIEDEFINEIDEYLRACMIQEYSLTPYSFLSFVNQLYETNPEFYEQLASNRNYNILVARIKELVKKYLMASLNVPEEKKKLASFKADFYLAGVASVYVEWIKNGKPFPFSHLAELIADELSIIMKSAGEFLR